MTLESAIAKIQAARNADYMYALTERNLERLLTADELAAWKAEKDKEEEDL